MKNAFQRKRFKVKVMFDIFKSRPFLDKNNSTTIEKDKHQNWFSVEEESNFMKCVQVYIRPKQDYSVKVWTLVGAVSKLIKLLTLIRDITVSV